MNVIGHQHISMDVQTILLGGLFQPFEIGQVVAISRENSLPVVATLNDVLRHAR